VTPPDFISMIGTLLPIALCGRSSLYYRDLAPKTARRMSRSAVTSDLMADLKYTPEIEVLSAADAARRRHWSDADKQRIVREMWIGSE